MKIQKSKQDNLVWGIPVFFCANLRRCSLAYLFLEDGSIYSGEFFGAMREVVGEVVFNTGMTGYQELLSDPSYHGQIVVMTYPLIGNYGANELDNESEGVQVKGFIVRENISKPCNWKMDVSIDEHLKNADIPAISSVDTRAITRKLREHGTMRGIITNNPDDAAMEKIKAYQVIEPVKDVTCKQKYRIEGSGYKVAVLDYGIKHGILDSLKLRDCDLTVYPSYTSAEEILADNPDGVFLSNGPGDPKDNPEVIEQIKKLIDAIPVFGICLGFQLIALAMGADTFKLRYGHRGCNHPVKDIEQNRTYITSQNHGYAVLPESLPDTVKVTHLNWNDQTLEGIALTNRPTFGVQFHPEGRPGPQDTAYLFDRFIDIMKKTQEGDK